MPFPAEGVLVVDEEGKNSRYCHNRPGNDPETEQCITIKLPIGTLLFTLRAHNEVYVLRNNLLIRWPSPKPISL